MSFFVGTTKTIFLLDLNLDGQPVVDVAAGEEVSYVIINPETEAVITSGVATYVAAVGETPARWEDDVLLPATAQILRVRWFVRTLDGGEAIEKWSTKLNVKAVP